jgi:GntR family transcriptional regulator/MocR family aminotransferase
LLVLLEAARSQLVGRLDISSVEAGLQTLGWLRGRIGAERVAELARDRDVEIVPLKQYAWGRAQRRGIVLGFAAVDPRELRRGVDILTRLLEKA